MHQRNLFDQPEPAPPCQKHSETSRAAAEQIEPRAATLRRAVLDFLRARGAQGATDEEGMTALAMAGNTYRPRRIECFQAGLIVDSGLTRPTRSGRQAVVWVVVAELKANEKTA